VTAAPLGFKGYAARPACEGEQDKVALGSDSFRQSLETSGGAAGRLIAARNWSTSPLGPIEDWPSSLKTALGMLLRSPVPIVMLWGEAGIMLYNDAYSGFAGARHPELLGSKVREGWPEVAGFNDNVMRVGLAGGTLEYRDQELTLYRNGVPEQVSMDLAYSPVPDDDDRPRGVLCILSETTERVAAERRLRELNETLESQVAERAAERDRLWNLSQDMLARADFSGMMSAVSPAWTQTLGWSEAELLSRGYATFMHPEDMPPTLEAIAGMAQNGEPARFENRIATRDGGWKPIEWTVAPEADGINFIAVGRDLSHAKARQAELEVTQEALRHSQKMEAMGQLTGGVAHDFNNLLTPILGSLDMLQRRGVGGDREQRLIGAALQSADRAKTLVQRLLAFARRQPLQPVAVDPSRLVSGMAELIATTVGPQIEFTVEAPEGLPAAKADPNQIEMALLNLSVNARDAMPVGGNLRIAASAEQVGPGHRSKLRAGRYIRIAVSDTGVGMDEETLAHAVEPFFSTKGIGQGTGLGLSMALGVAQQLDGALTIQSTKGKGTTVELWLPLSEKPADADQRAGGRPIGGAVSGTALLVDDEELVRMSTAEMLTELGYAVVEASSAQEALTLLGKGLRPNLVVSDHLMPGMTGAELAAQLRAEGQGVPILIISGYAENAGLAPDLPRLTKPFRQPELAAVLANLSTVRVDPRSS
jgi:PAS domain S-box-containing protein